MIQIENLTQYQVDMLDHMWSLENEEAYFEWWHLLDEDDQRLADSLQEMIVLATLDNSTNEYKDAKKLLKKFVL